VTLVRKRNGGSEKGSAGLNLKPFVMGKGLQTRSLSRGPQTKIPQKKEPHTPQTHGNEVCLSFGNYPFSWMEETITALFSSGKSGLTKKGLASRNVERGTRTREAVCRPRFYVGLGGDDRGNERAVSPAIEKEWGGAALIASRDSSGKITAVACLICAKELGDKGRRGKKGCGGDTGTSKPAGPPREGTSE